MCRLTPCHAHVHQDAARPGYIQCFNPATGHFLGEVPVTTPAEVRDAIGRARAAQQVWAGTSWAERRRVMMMLNAAVIANADAICRVSTVDTGKTSTFTHVLGGCRSSLQLAPACPDPPLPRQMSTVTWARS